MEKSGSETAGTVSTALPETLLAGPTAASVRRFLGRFGMAALWQVLGKLIGVVGLGYAYRCLGPDNVGISGNILATVMFGQLALDFGLDIVSVRHAASRSLPLSQLIQALFTTRLLLAGAGFVLFSTVAALMPAEPAVRWVWWVGGVHLVFLNLNFSWYCQATERMPFFSLTQNVSTVVTTVLILLSFRPGQRVGSDLVVAMIVNAAMTVGVWYWIARHERLALFNLRSLPLALRLFREARPTWVFNLAYFALSNMSLPLSKYLLGNSEAGNYRAAAVLVNTLQVFLNYFALMLNPRIVQWRSAPPGRLRLRLMLMTAAVVLAGGLCFAVLWPVRVPLTLLLCGREFESAASLLPVLVSAKFFALASGLLVWGLFANYREWVAVGCCVPVLLVTFLASIVLIPVHGIQSAAWMNFAGEFGLLLLCFLALNYVEQRRARAVHAK